MTQTRCVVSFLCIANNCWADNFIFHPFCVSCVSECAWVRNQWGFSRNQFELPLGLSLDYLCASKSEESRVRFVENLLSY
jgi:hypothetical protein